MIKAGTIKIIIFTLCHITVLYTVLRIALCFKEILQQIIKTKVTNVNNKRERNNYGKNYICIPQTLKIKIKFRCLI